MHDDNSRLTGGLKKPEFKTWLHKLVTCSITAGRIALRAQIRTPAEAGEHSVDLQTHIWDYF